MLKGLFLNDHIQDFTEVQIADIISRLPLWRRETALRFKHQQGQRENALAFLELCRGLRQLYDISKVPQFAYNEHGKPYFKEYPDIHFNLSHCREVVGCLLSNHPCGLDIERIRHTEESLIRHTMNDEECQQILHSPTPDLTFTALWTQKEAVLKLQGTGITDNLRNTLSPNSLSNIQLETIQNPSRGYVVSIAQARPRQ